MESKQGKFNLNDNTHYIMVRDGADSLLKRGVLIEDLWDIVRTADLFDSLSAFLAISRIKLNPYINKKLRIAIVMNLIHEHNRLRPSSLDNPTGEDSLKNKLDQLEWLFGDTNITYKLIYVSGGCPWGSDDILEREIKRSGSRDVVHIRVDNYKTGKLISKNKKGGEIIFGIKSVLQLPGYADEGFFDAMLYTDADMTFDLGQMGLMIEKYYSGQDISTGNRMDSDSILEKNMVRAGSGVLMYRHIQRKLTPGFFIDMQLHDTQCPWKFLSGRVLDDIVMDLDSMDWSIDTDILSAAKSHGYEPAVVPVTAIDSELESHGKAIGHFRRNRTIIEGAINQAAKYGLPYDKKMAELVRSYLKTDEDYRKLLEAGLPPAVKNLPNKDWGISPLLTDSLVERWLKKIECGNNKDRDK